MFIKKAFPALLLLGVAAASPLVKLNDLPVKFGLCKFPPFQGEFNISEFFDKTWYVWKTEGYLFSNVFSCAGMDTKIVRNDIQILNFQYEPLLNGFISIRGDADANYVQSESLFFPITYNFGGHKLEIAFSIIGTDYDDWAAVYFCKQYLGFKIEMSWLMSTDRKFRPTEEQLSGISKAASLVGFDLEDYKTQDDDACQGRHEPHL